MTEPPQQQVWTFYGHWEDHPDGDRIVIEWETPGRVADRREDTGRWPLGLWAAAGEGATVEEAEACAIAEYYEDKAAHSS